jgi:phosphoribosylanthranilate isomerase
VIGDPLIAKIAAAVPAPTETFLLTARTRAEAIAEQHAQARTTTLQLVDHVAHTELRTLRTLCPGVRLVQVIHVRDEASIREALEAAPWVDALLLDSGNPLLAVKQLGGTGRTHDWKLSRRIRDKVAPSPVFLAGGLRDQNVAEAVRTVAPFGVDLCNGVRTDGRLDAAKLRRFFAALAQQ